ncbi:MAG: hypothetical protein ABIJ95_07930, partial [Pseudomonadota bacterium]
PACRRGFTAITGTLMAGAALGFREVFLLAALLGQGKGNVEIAGRAGCTAETVRLWRARFRRESGQKFSGERGNG